jgi:PAS domain S-box-containing protein
MSIHKKTMLMLSVMLGIFILSVIGNHYLNLREHQVVLLNTMKEQQFLIDQALKSKHDQMSMMVRDNSAWDELVKFCDKSPDTIWSKNNIDFMAQQYKLNYIWIYNKEKKLHHSYNNSTDQKSQNVLTPNNISQLFKQGPYCSFFIKINKSIIEVDGATIVPSADNELRKSLPKGYFFVGRTWDSSYIYNLQNSTNFFIALDTILTHSDKYPVKDKKQFQYSRSVLNNNGKEIAKLFFTSKNNIQEEVYSIIYLTLSITIFALFVFLFSFFLLNKLLSKPLSQIISALDKNDISIIQQMKSKNDEFGQIAKLVESFFIQQRNLEQLNNQLVQKNEEIISQNDEIQKQVEKNNLAQKVLTVLNRNLTNQTFALNETAFVTITDINARITYANEQFYAVSGYTESEIIGQNPRILKPEGFHNPLFYKDMWDTIAVKKTKWRGEICNKFKDGSLNWFDMTIVPFLDQDGNIYQYMSIKIDINEKKMAEKEIKLKNAELHIQKQKVELIHSEITSSIEYAKNIQKALMPSGDLLDELLPRYLILLKPKDIVSGDFYWATRDKHKIFFAVGDCTGHGVPGAFMSMLGISLLNEIVQGKDITKPSLILNELRKMLKKAMHQTGEENIQHDGMDIALCAVDLNTMKLEFAGANRNLYLIRRIGDVYPFSETCKLNVVEIKNKEYSLFELKGDKMPIGVSFNEKESFLQAEFKINKRDTYYLTSDGFQDQFGGPGNHKFSSKQLKNLLLSIQKMSLNEQKQLLLDKFRLWQGDNDQTDDMLILGMKF